jgi:hypothetical protein
MKLKALRDKRARLLREAEGLRQADGTFADDETRAAFDAKMTAIAELDDEIREADASPDPAPTTEPADATAARAEGARVERERIDGIRRGVRAAGLEERLADELVNGNVPIEQARTRILQELEGRTPQIESGRGVDFGEDEGQKWNRGVAAWLFQKAGVSELVRQAAEKRKGHAAFANVSLDPGEFRGLSLLDLCRASLERRGIRAAGLSKHDLVARALEGRGGVLGAQTTSDFTVALENVLHKTLLAAYSITPDTWSMFCATGSVSDFRAHNRYRTGFLGRMEKVLESGEFKNKSIPDAVKESITAEPKGFMLTLSRQAIVNDDMVVFSRVATMAGRASKLSIELDVYDLLKLNAGLGPTMGDGNTLFHASHANIGTGAALSADSIDADRVVLASQTDPSGNEVLDLRPAVLVLPIGLGGKARSINLAQYDWEQSSKFQKPNTVQGLFRDIVDTPRLSGTRRYTFADPSLMPVIEVAFLDGQMEPFLEMKDGWRVDGVEWKVRHDYGVAAIEWRGAVTNAGA